MNERTLFDAALEISDVEARNEYLDQACSNEPDLRSRLDLLLQSHSDAGSFLDLPIVERWPYGAPERNSETSLLDPGSFPLSADPTAIGGERLATYDFEEGDSVEMNDTYGYSPDHVGSLDHEMILGLLTPSDRPGSLGRLGHYDVTEILGRGSFGIVLKAFDEKLHRTVAIKAMSPVLAATSPSRKRFLREARAAAAIRDDNVVAIYAVEEQPLPCLVMEFIPGPTLQRALDEHGPFDIADVLRVGAQIAHGLAAAHAHGLIHRDIKPSNILLENGIAGRVKLTDFGLARAVDDASLTRSGTIAGTPMYMSPEQAQSHPIDQRSDLFSLGSVLYRMLSGRPPFRAPTTLAVLKRVSEDTPRPIQDIIPGSPDWLCAVIGKLQAKQPEDRFASAGEVAELLSRCLADWQANRPVKLPEGMQIAVEEPVETAAQVNRLSASEVSSPLAPASGERARERGRSSTSARRWPIIAAMAFVLLAGLGFTETTGVTKLTATVIRLSTGSGTLVIEADPGVQVMIDGEEVRIEGAGVEELSLKPGKYRVAATKDGTSVSQELVTITRGGREVVRVTLEKDQSRIQVVQATRPGESMWRGWPADAPKLAIAPFDADQAQKSQEDWAKYLGVPVEYTNSIGMTFRLIPPGEFLMGGTAEEVAEALSELADQDSHWRECIQSEARQHQAILTHPLFIGVDEVTQAQYARVMGKNPSYFASTGAGAETVADEETKRFPVETVSWNDAIEFCTKLTERERLRSLDAQAAEQALRFKPTGYRLPSEAEWEFACRAGSVWNQAAKEHLPATAWFRANCDNRPHAVGQRVANPFGLFDMHGNIWEWTQDEWTAADNGQPATEKSKVVVPRVLRGGGWDFPISLCRSSARSHSDPEFLAYNIGFRVVCQIAIGGEE